MSCLVTDCPGGTAVTATQSGVYDTELRYKAWGETRYTYGTAPTAKHYTGQYEEAEIGLYYYNARWYDPALSRFVQADTIVPQPGSPMAWDRYSYGFNNPSRYKDPSGHFSQEEIQKFFGVKSWDEVLKKFDKGGELEGRWGWLSILQKAELGNEITIHWDVDQLPKNHPDVKLSFSGKFEKGRNGDLLIVGENSYFSQIKAGKYGIEYELIQRPSQDIGKIVGGMFLIIVVDLGVGIPCAYVIAQTGGNPLAFKAAEILELTVVTPATLFGLKLIYDGVNPPKKTYKFPAYSSSPLPLY